MCNLTLSMEALGVAYLVDFERYFAVELAELRELERYGLITMREGWINVTARGRPLVRSVCSVFDRYLRHDREARAYSRVI
jgi:oxygen-independent coproporphyrinogen-3 oxidase